MNRRSALALAGVAAIGAVVPFALERSTGDAQDNTDARLDALETRVAVIETTIAPPVASQSVGVVVNVGTPDTSNLPTLTNPGDSITVIGRGEMQSSMFTLTQGSYVVTITITQDATNPAESFESVLLDARQIGSSHSYPLEIAAHAGDNLVTYLPVTGVTPSLIHGSGSNKLTWTVTLTKE